MVFGSAAIAVTVLSVLLGIVCVVGLLWLIPVFLDKQKAVIKRKQVQKKANEEMVRNIRYRSPSTVGIQPQIRKTFDYGSTQARLVDNSADVLLRNIDLEKNDLPSINITCDEESLTHAQDVDEKNKIQAVDIFVDKNSLQSSKRRFSSIVFTHSDEIKVLSDGENLEIGSDKRERRASMSLFDTCKLACPDLSQNLGHSTEHLNQMILPVNDNQGKLYFMLSQKESNKRVLEVIVIKITDIANRKHKDYFLQMDLIESDSNIIYSTETSIKVCSGEVVSFDESFLIDLDGKMGNVNDDGEGLHLLFTLINIDTKKGGKTNRIGEIRFDLMELIEGHVLRFDGEEQFVICRHFVNLTSKVKHKESSGKVLIFLRFSKVAPLNFVIGVAELKDLKSTKPFNSVNVRISLATELKVLESRRSKVIKKKYQTVEGILKLDESFEFNMSLHKLSTKDLSKSPFNFSSENAFVTLFICGRNNIGFSHVLGKCVLGSIEFADGAGLFHWNKAISNLGDIVYQWHSLKN